MRNTWLRFTDSVKDLMAGDYQIANLQSFLLANLRQGVIDIQRYVPEYGVGHETTFLPGDLRLEGSAHRGCLNHELTELVHVEFVDKEDECARRLVWVEPWKNRQDLICGCRTESDFAGIAFNISTGHFYVYPAIPEGYKLIMEWNGMKRVFEDGDCVPFDESMAQVVADYLRWRIKRDLDHDMAAARELEASYIRARRNLYVDARNRSVLVGDRYRDGKDDCLKCYEISACTALTAKEESKDFTFAAVGDFGMTAPGAAGTPVSGDPYYEALIPNFNKEIVEKVAALMRCWDPRAMLFLGDVNYDLGARDTLQVNLIDHFGDWIPNSQAWLDGKLTATTVQTGYAVAETGASGRMSIPVWGNHDLLSSEDGVAGGPLLGLYPEIAARNSGKLYYDYEVGHAHFFVLNSAIDDTGSGEPDGINVNSTQYYWLRAALAASTARWKIVLLHRPPWTESTVYRTGSEVMRWDYGDLGADLVLAGHAHAYQRVHLQNYVLATVGTGGAALHTFNFKSPETRARYNGAHGALRGVVTENALKLEFWNINGEMVDCLTLKKEC